jgi:hypothetical protein
MVLSKRKLRFLLLFFLLHLVRSEEVLIEEEVVRCVTERVTPEEVILVLEGKAKPSSCYSLEETIELLQKLHCASPNRRKAEEYLFSELKKRIFGLAKRKPQKANELLDKFIKLVPDSLLIKELKSCVAKALITNRLSLSAWGSLIFGSLVLYGGLATCLVIITRREKKTSGGVTST